ncbi:hypothetical protein [Sphingomonas endolithica]|uniref:hypothetical protein n=1 Tax=Sphingomonas endolithica TaxID=2972485 RepID=UPI0021AF27A4|nr:hypothetical protein [Sphingomonas sp. ZFBP2030]
MARTLKLDDLHLILLSTATQRDNGNVLPVAATIADQGDRITKALPALLKHKLVDEVVGLTTGPAWRSDGDERFARCCQSNANRSPHDALWSLSAIA